MQEMEIQVENENFSVNVNEDYAKIKNKPQINEIELKAGNNTLDELGIQAKGDYALKSELPDVKDFVTKDADNLTNYITKNKIEEEYAKKDEIPNVDNFITNETDNLLNYYKKSDTYSQTEFDNNLEDKLKEYAKTSQIPDVSNLVTEESFNEKLQQKADKSEIPNLEDYYTKSETYSNTEIDEKIKEASGADLSAYLKKAEASETYLDKVTASETYATKDELPDTKDFITESTVDTKLENYVTNQALEEKHYLTEHQDISNLATKEELNLKANKTDIPDVSNYITNDTSSLTNYTTTNDLKETYASKTELPKNLSDLINDIFVECSSEEEAKAQSLENPGKLYYVVVEE